VIAALIGLAAPVVWVTSRSFPHHYALLSATVAMVCYSVGYAKSISDGVGVRFAEYRSQNGVQQQSDAQLYHVGFSFYCFGLGVASSALAFLLSISHSCTSLRGSLSLCIATGSDATRLRPHQRGRRFGWISLGRMPYEAHMLHIPTTVDDPTADEDEPVELPRVTINATTTELPS